MDMNKLNIFKVRMHKCDFKKADKLKAGLYELEIITTPKIHYLKWYWKVLNFLTFRRFFNIVYTYTVKLIK